MILIIMLKKIFKSSTKGRIAKNFLVLICGNIIAQIFAIFSTVYLARVLGINGFGKIGFAQGIISYFSLLADFGLRTVGIREIAKNKEEIKKYVSHLLTIRLFLAVVSFVLLSVLILFLPKPVDYKILIALFGLNIFPLVFLIDWVFQALEKMEFQAIGDGIRALFYLNFVCVACDMENIFILGQHPGTFLSPDYMLYYVVGRIHCFNLFTIAS